MILRVLSGGQEGAEMKLEAQRYQLGRDEQCAIVLEDETIATQHLDMVFASGKLLVLSAQGGLRHQGVMVETFPHEIEPLEIFMAGQTALAYGGAEDAWPDKDALEEALAQNDNDDEAKADEKPSAASPSKRQLGWLARAGVLVFAAMFLAAGASSVALAFMPHTELEKLTAYAGLAAPPVAAPDQRATERDFWQSQLARDDAFAHIRISGAKDAVEKISGWVEKSSDRNRLMVLASTRGVEADLVSLDQLHASLTLLTALYGENLFYTLEPAQAGRIGVSLSGIIQDSHMASDLRQHLQRDLPNVAITALDILTRRQAIARLEDRLVHHPALARLGIESDSHGLVVRGGLLNNFHQDFQQAQKEFAALLPAGVKIREALTIAPSFNGRVKSVLIGADKRVMLAHQDMGLSGVYREQDHLPDNFLLHRIERGRLLLQWNNQLFSYPFTFVAQNRPPAPFTQTQ